MKNMGLICEKGELKKILREQYNSKVIVSACGCFEIFHVGHLEYIEGAKKLGDVLIVGINSDKYIEKNKNRKPIFNEEERCRIIASLQNVDYVFLFDDETFDNCLKDLKPDYFVKGCDRTEILELETANKLGIAVKHIGSSKKASATELRKYFL